MYLFISIIDQLYLHLLLLLLLQEMIGQISNTIMHMHAHVRDIYYIILNYIGRVRKIKRLLNISLTLFVQPRIVRSNMHASTHNITYHKSIFFPVFHLTVVVSAVVLVFRYGVDTFYFYFYFYSYFDFLFSNHLSASFKISFRSLASRMIRSSFYI